MGYQTRFRHEKKYEINYGQYLNIRSRLRAVCMPDPHARDDGTYLIRSIYFDNMSDKALAEKISGLAMREKFRIRYYNDDLDYVENGGYEKLTQRLHSQIDELVETDPTSFYTYDEYKAAYTMLDEVVHLRAESIKGQLDKTIPSTSEGQKEDASSLIDASAIDTSVMGRMGMGNNDNGKKEEPVQSSSSTENSR